MGWGGDNGGRGIQQLSCRGERLLRDLCSADDARDFHDALLRRQLAHGGFRPAVRFRFGYEKMRVGDRRNLWGMCDADDLCAVFGNLVELYADFMGGPAGNTGVDFVEK